MSMHFRELIKPGTNFEFVGNARRWLLISGIVIALSIAMLPINYFLRGSPLNFSIDFKGGTDIVLTFDKKVTTGDVRSAMQASGYKSVDVSTFNFRDEQDRPQEAFLVRVPQFGALSSEQANQVADDFVKELGGPEAVVKATWSGDTFYARTTKPLTEADFKKFFASKGLEPKSWSLEQQQAAAAPLPGTTEYNYQVPVYGLDRNIQSALSSKLATTATIKQVDAVGAKAGAELRNDGIRSMLYAIALILLYIAFRFDFRYGPGTVAALLHDAILVVGVFAVTWTEFSLTTVAALLTVIGYSMNDTVVVFDRIRENEHKLRDKRFDRVINISINETLSRTFLTSLTTFVVTLAMNLLGTGLVKNFAFAMNVGIVVGTYSSIFIAAPILLFLNERFFARRAAAGTRPQVPSPEPSA